MTWAILTDVPRCIGCQECVTACQRFYRLGPDEPHGWQRQATDLSATRWTTVVQTPSHRFVRFHCRHCLDPACVAACPVAALARTPEGVVTYDAATCLGCRYCMLACPFAIPRYEWGSPTPVVQKCLGCHEAIEAGEISQPACTAACPADATIFGPRDALLAEARARIRAARGRYVDRVWGEHEIGGTSVLYVSDIDLTGAGWPSGLDQQVRPRLARQVLGTVPYTFVGMAALLTGLHWTFERRRKVAEAAEAARNAEHPSGEEER